MGCNDIDNWSDFILFNPPLNVATVSVENGTENTFACIVVDSGDMLTSVYNLESMEGMKRTTLIRFAREWWLETDRVIPLPVYIGPIAEVYDDFLVDYPTRNVRFAYPERVYNLRSSYPKGKRIRKTVIELVDDGE